ncbi:DUF6338 family protein [Cellulomonas sp. CW35]|uniref:DUF6338 family protein n=1 Tax=Cellulomonas sp. CW35 TaxID=3458249 RepID=UPI0040342E5C
MTPCRGARRARGLGASTISATLKVGEGLAAGVVFDLVYLAVFGAALTEAFTLSDGRQRRTHSSSALSCRRSSRGSLTGAADGPRRPLARSGGCSTRRARYAEWWTANVGRVVPAFSRIPTAWDAAAPNLGRRFVRIETASGKFVGGWFGENSFVSTYPEPHDLYVEQQWRMSETGEFLLPRRGSVPRTDRRRRTRLEGSLRPPRKAQRNVDSCDVCAWADLPYAGRRWLRRLSRCPGRVTL